MQLKLYNAQFVQQYLFSHLPVGFNRVEGTTDTRLLMAGDSNKDSVPCHSLWKTLFKDKEPEEEGKAKDLKCLSTANAWIGVWAFQGFLVFSIGLNISLLF